MSDDKPTHLVPCRIACIDTYDDADADVWVAPLADDVRLVDTYQAEWIDMPEVMPPETERVPGAMLYVPRRVQVEYSKMVDDLRQCATSEDAHVLAEVECDRVRREYGYGKIKRTTYHGRCVGLDIVTRQEDDDE